MKAFVTGSRAYGQPSRNSDIDLVVLVSIADLTKLRMMADSDDREKLQENSNSDAGPNGGGESASLRFGNLNLLCVTDLTAYAAWKQGTALLKREKEDARPVSRDLAVKFFEAVRRHHGLYDHRPTVQEVRDTMPRKPLKEPQRVWGIGDSVKFPWKGSELVGLITEIDEDTDRCTVSHRGEDYEGVPMARLAHAPFPYKKGTNPKPARPERAYDDDPFRDL